MLFLARLTVLKFNSENLSGSAAARWIDFPPTIFFNKQINGVNNLSWTKNFFSVFNTSGNKVSNISSLDSSKT